MYSYTPLTTRCLVVLAGGVLFAASAPAQQPPAYQRDRGNGIATSMFATYVGPHELLVYPFFEYTVQNLEYKPGDLGYGVNQDYRGRYHETESFLFLAYGVSHRLALEFEGALHTRARLRKSPSDTSAMPATFGESGLGDVQVEARWRWNDEAASRPEIFSYFETDFPFQRHRKLIGTQDWQFKFGTGAIKGFAFGTVTVRAAAEYHQDVGTIDLGEYAVEYMRRLSDTWRVYGGIEGRQDEVELITEAQYRLGAHSVLKLNTGFGLTAKAPRWAPEVGILFSF
jgi:hypothetical protein